MVSAIRRQIRKRSRSTFGIPALKWQLQVCISSADFETLLGSADCRSIKRRVHEASVFHILQPLAILAIISNQCRRRHAWEISTDKPACVNRFKKLLYHGQTFNNPTPARASSPRTSELSDTSVGARAPS